MEIKCFVCEIDIDRAKSQLTKSGRNYCSRHCYSLSNIPRGFKRTGIEKICEVCKNNFYVPPIRKDAKFCSTKCKGIASRLQPKSCVVCNNEFKPIMGRSKQPCCSIECGNKYRIKGINILCAQCKKEFYVTYSRKDKAKFCSKECANIWQGRNKIEYTCITCDHKFNKSASHEKFGNIKFCSIDCRNNNEQFKTNLLKIGADQNKSKLPNKLESLGYSILESLKINYIPQYFINNKFTVDAFLPDKNVVIQFDGDYWHGNKNMYQNPDNRQLKRMKLDISQDAYMSKIGIKTIRFWESEFKDINYIIESIARL